MSFYGRLFAYRPRPLRTPTEDFLSEALADLLNRLPKIEHVLCIANVLLKGAARSAWLDFTVQRPNATLEWVTQRRIKYKDKDGILDLLLLIDGQEAIVVENKIGAIIQDHGRTPLVSNVEAGDNLEEEQVTQLHTYANWLHDRCIGAKWPGALVLLTQYSKPPAHYGDASYGLQHVRISHWRDVWLWARSSIGQESKEEARETWMDLRAELAGFLEEQNMTAEYMTMHDLARAEVFVAGASRIYHTFKAIDDRLGDLRKELRFGRSNFVNYESKGSVVCSWARLSDPSPSAQWYIWWGIRFPESSDWWTACKPPLPLLSHAFVLLKSDYKEIPIEALDVESLGRWAISDRELITGQELYKFSSDAAGFTADMGDWIIASITDLRPKLEQLIKAFEARQPVGALLPKV